MTTNLVLKSQNSLSYDSGVATFKVFWNQFLDDPYGQYLVSFSFITAVDANLDENDLYTLQPLLLKSKEVINILDISLCHIHICSVFFHRL